MSENTGSLPNIPLRKTHVVEVDYLRLDSKNPRLLGKSADANESQIVAHLYRAEDLSELLESIAANGYLDIEPLIVLAENDSLIVLEGNRRLAAIRLFRDSHLVQTVREESQIKITIPSISEQHMETLDRVSVYRVQSREDARSFVGFKHINGAARWDSYAKAKFAADWYRSNQATLDDIAKQIGDRHATIKRMVSAIYVLEQAKECGVFSIDDRVRTQFSFSHLYTALSRGPYMKYLGLEPNWTSFEPKPNPIPPENIDQLTEVLHWIYGSKEHEIDPVVRSQNPDIRRLAEILENNAALLVLRASKSLDEAHDSVLPADHKLSSSLIRAREDIRDASNNLRGFDGQDDSVVNIAADVSESAQAVHSRLIQKVRDASSDTE